MKTTRWQAVLFACVVVLALAAAALTARTTTGTTSAGASLAPFAARAVHSLAPFDGRSTSAGQRRAALGKPATGDHAPATTLVSIAVGTSHRAPALGHAAQATDTEQAPEPHFFRPIVRIGQNYTLRAGDVVHDLHTAFADVTLEGRVEYEAVVVLGDVHAKSTAVLDRSLVVVGGSATIDQGAVVNGDLVVIGGTLTAPPDFSPRGEHVVIGSPAVGDALNTMVPWITRGLLWGRLIVPDLAWIWVLVAIGFLVALALNLLFDRPVRVCADAIAEKPFSTFLLGLLVLVLTVPALVVLSATVVGIAVVPFVVCAMLVGGLIGKVGVYRAIGRGLVAPSSPESRLQSLRSFLLGFVVVGLAYMVPILGVVTWALTGVFAVGAAAAMLRAMLRREHPPRARVAPPVTAGAAVAAGHAADPATALQASDAGSWQGTPETPGAPGQASEAAAPEAAAPEAWNAAVPPVPVEGRTVPSPPVPGSLLGYPHATFLDRVAAFALDCVLVAIAVQVLNVGGDGRFPLMLFLYHVAFWAWKGTTLGGIVVGLRVVRATGGSPRFVDALVRGLASILSLAALGIGCFWMLQDRERQMWHDKIAGTVVNKVPREVALA